MAASGSGLEAVSSGVSSRRSGVFVRSSGDFEADDEEALKWAALEKLPTYDRLRTAILKTMKGSKVEHEEVDVRTIDHVKRQQIINAFFRVSPEEDNEIFLAKLRQRIDRVGVQLPTVEVRYQNLKIEADAHVGGRALPTLSNVARDWFEAALEMVGISLTRKTKIHILMDVSGIIKSGRMTLLLGPPGSGKTSLLLALAGKLEKSLEVSGVISYNGYKLNEFVPQKSSAYISQQDLHIGEMTVRETLDYSARFQGVGTRYELITELAKREKELGIKPEPEVDVYMKATSLEGVESSLCTDYIMKILGLDICSDILVGDQMRRGISGGQRKRVTTGEMIVGPTRTLFMDEISTGLDSSTTFQIVKCLRQFAHVMEATVLMSLLQPAPETYDLFDDILLLSEGQVVYHGPREHILEFFESCGFKCPERKGVADFLQEVTSRKDQEQYFHDRNVPYQYFSVTEFADAFKRFHVGGKINEELAVPYDKEKGHKAALSFQRYSVSKWELFKANYDKEKLLIKRNSFLYIFKSVMIGLMGLVALSVYFRTRMTRNDFQDATLFGGALFFGVIMVMFNGFTELAMTVSRLPVFYKQRDMLFYPGWAWALPSMVVRIPMSIFEAGIYCILTYYTIGFAPAASRFFRQLFLYFWIHQMSSALFRMIAGICRSMVVANTGGSLTLLIVFCLGGFLIPRTQIKKWWIWGYWISPLAYAENGISVNEYLAPQWRKAVEGYDNTLGVQYLLNGGIFPHSYWYWISVAAMIGFTILFNILFTISISLLNPLGKPNAVVSQETLAEQHANRTGEDIPMIATKSTPRSLSLVSKGERSIGRGQGDGGLVQRSSLSLSGQRASNVSSDRPSFELGNAAGVAPKRGMILPFQPLALSFNDVKYFVDMPAEMRQQGAEDEKLQLLRGVTGAFRPGVLTALVGVSGAGKTTLMDVLAGRKTGGYIEGDIRISGFPKKQETFARISGYCEQNDIHSPQVTIYESLIYSAWLRLPSDIDGETKTQFVQEVMDLVELTTLRDALVGLPGVTGLSTEQRKRLTIAVELVANPSIIFMDEPTSGLDARAAAIVMRTVRNTVDTGRTVVCTIHQPSIDIFEAFDELLLMKRGGQVIYAGPLGRHSHRLVEYFETVAGVPKLKQGYNPATWMLEITSLAAEQRLGVDFADVYHSSSLFQRNKALVGELSTPGPNAKDLLFPTQYSQPFFAQLSSCLWKQFLTYWRSPDYNNVRFTFTLVSALLFGSIFWDLGSKRDNSSSLSSVMGAMYGASLFLGVNNASTVMPLVATERTVFYRERAAGMYSAVPYAIAQVLIELPYCLIQTIAFGLITYAMISLEWTAAKLFWYLFFLFCTLLYFTYYGMMAVALTPNHNIASIVASGFYSVFNLFSGYLITRPRLPVWWLWYYYICPVSWSLNGLITSQFGDLDSDVLVPGKGSVTMKRYLKDTFDFDHDFLPYVAIVMVAFPVLFAMVFAFGIKFLNFQRR